MKLCATRVGSKLCVVHKFVYKSEDTDLGGVQKIEMLKTFASPRVIIECG